MKKQSGKKGRPLGASQYADEDRAPLERMYVLCKQGKAVNAAAKAVAKEMPLRPSPAQATERLRKKFRQFREEKEKASPSTHPEPQSGTIPSADAAERERQVREFLRTPEGQAAVRWASENQELALKVAERMHRIRKPKI
jgi:hypothetical protein